MNLLGKFHSHTTSPCNSPKVTKHSRIQHSNHNMDHSAAASSLSSSSSSSPLNNYNIESLFKQSRYNEIFIATNQKGKKVIIKKINKDKTQKEFLENEIKASTIVKHQNIARFYEHFEEGKFIYIVMEFIEGSDFFELLEAHTFKPIREKYVKKIFKKVLKTVLYLHKNGVVHRDLKLENIMLLTNRKSIKILDFGLCSIGKSCRDKIGQSCGSPDYVSPEIMAHEQYIGCKADVWSLGTLLFTLLYAELPFSLEERIDCYSRGVAHPSLVFPDTLKEPVSQEAKDLIQKMLNPDERKRPFLEDLSSHPWLKFSVFAKHT